MEKIRPKVKPYKTDGEMLNAMMQSTDEANCVYGKNVMYWSCNMPETKYDSVCESSSAATQFYTLGGTVSKDNLKNYHY